MKYIADAINRAHKATFNVIILLENMAGQGSVLGSTFEQLRDIIEQIKDKTRIGVCLDTCHLFAGGYDISTKKSFDKVLSEFDDIVGLKFLMAMHLNDSKGELGCHADRHENLGKGHLGLEAFEYIMNNDVFSDMPLVLETPIGKNEDFLTWQKEIDLLYSLVKDRKE